MFKLQIILALVIFVYGISADISKEKLNAAQVLYCGKCKFDGSPDLVTRSMACIEKNAPDSAKTLAEKLAAAKGNIDECVKLIKEFDQNTITENPAELQKIHQCIDENITQDNAAKCKA